ncbi:uncharacterized protein N7477_005245 [Penicillium maclennaniae]|uniref:uncharacterized protein n=1 Tax=Penicillium maclennaniae TaxID=1343394 RepID=UPI0025409535|nr:uncharacterized protein N7477_005245 [Penicillium maclennaniae]KAJ5675311.1 hypothetical protein N7477_005245 [Penicillium maclennaniae]
MAANRRVRTLLLALIALLLTLSFAFAVAATASRAWVWRKEFDEDGQPTGRLFWRAPLGYCQVLQSGAAPSCHRSSKPAKYCYLTARDSAPECALLRLAGQLLIAGCVLLGVSMVVSVASVTLQRLVSRRSVAGAAGAVLLGLAAPAAFVCMAVAHLTGGFVLLAMQFPNGETGTADNDQLSSMWVGDKGLVYVAASWTIAGFASLLIVTEAGVMRPALEAIEEALPPPPRRPACCTFGG